jgi:hypothetical protein
MLEIQTISAPTLSSGAVDVTFGQFEEISDVFVSFDGPNKADYVFEVVRAISGNVVTLTFYTMQTSAGGPTWATAGDADITGTVTVIANGQ